MYIFVSGTRSILFYTCTMVMHDNFTVYKMYMDVFIKFIIKKDPSESLGWGKIVLKISFQFFRLTPLKFKILILNHYMIVSMFDSVWMIWVMPFDLHHTHQDIYLHNNTYYEKMFFKTKFCFINKVNIIHEINYWKKKVFEMQIWWPYSKYFTCYSLKIRLFQKLQHIIKYILKFYIK